MQRAITVPLPSVWLARGPNLPSPTSGGSVRIKDRRGGCGRAAPSSVFARSGSISAGKKQMLSAPLASLASRALKRLRPDTRYADLSSQQHALFERVRPYTQTSRERVTTLADAVRYVVNRGIPGDFVECGVWRGGSSMAIAITLLELGSSHRELWLYDTFTHMPPAGEWDRDHTGGVMSREEPWPSASVEEVQAAVASTGYPRDNVHYVEGMVEQTIPDAAPDRIALLRLDTDWYSSTRHELAHLYPRLAPGGVLIIDDYGHFAGARKAVDEYFTRDPVLLIRVDYTCRMAIKAPNGV